MSHPLVGNIYKEGRNGGVYIGRERTGIHHYGNPFTHNKQGTLAQIVTPTREMAIAAFKDWLEGTDWHSVEPERRKWILEHLKDLKGKRLICFCAPQACHGDILAEKAAVESSHGNAEVTD